MLRFIIIAIFCFLGFLLIHILIFQLIQVKECAKTVFRIFYFFLFLYSLASLIFCLSARRGDVWLFALNGMLIYTFLFMGYLEFYFTVDRSITTRMMILLEKSPDNKMTYEQVRQAYDLDNIFKRRFRDMVYGGYMTENNGYYENTEKGRLVAKIYEFSRRLLRLRD